MLYLLPNLLFVYSIPYVCVCVHVFVFLTQSQHMVKWAFRAVLSYRLSSQSFNLSCGVRTSLFTTSRMVLRSDFTTNQWGLLLLGKLSHCQGWVYEVTPLLLYTFMTWCWVTLEAKLKHHAMESMCQVELEPAYTLSVCTRWYSLPETGPKHCHL